MNNDELIKRIIKIAQEFESDARYIDCHNFTHDLNHQTPFVQSDSKESYERAADMIYKLVAEYMSSNNQRCSYSNRVNYLIKQRNNRVLSLETIKR